jgi:mRNA-degrading endonuclease RelE of RelBE toxin-antitoxin system
VRRRIEEAIASLAVTPYPDGRNVAQLTLGTPQLIFRRRVGDWRILFTRDDVAHSVAIVAIQHRREAYGT